jgi:hypothetical protein
VTREIPVAERIGGSVSDIISVGAPARRRSITDRASWRFRASVVAPCKKNGSS